MWLKGTVLGLRLKGMAFWAIALGISFGIGALGIMNQGLAFIIMYMLIQILLTYEDNELRTTAKKIDFLRNILFLLVVLVFWYGFLSLLAFITAKVFGISFYIAFQLLTLGESIYNLDSTPKQ